MVARRETKYSESWSRGVFFPLEEENSTALRATALLGGPATDLRYFI